MSDVILSAGIDVGTTTTQLIFSRLTMEKTGGYGVAPKLKIVNREVIYRSAVYYTPLTGDDIIDAAGVAGLIRKEYEAAGIAPVDLVTGAVIITGESAGKRNAKEVTMKMAELAGEFVVAAAGPDLESVLAGKGAGADRLSEETGQAVLNIDIGGGTSNLCLFKEGMQIDCACYDIGGRVIRLDAEHRVEKISPKVAELLPELGISLKVGDKLTVETGQRVAAVLADFLAGAANLKDLSVAGRKFQTNHGLKPESRPALISFSGGVADCLAEDGRDLFAYGDLGILLGREIMRHPLWKRAKKAVAKETMRATVIGAGNCSMEVSGSTVFCRGADFPMKNLPVQKLYCSSQQQIDNLDMQLTLLKQQQTETFQNGYAIAMDGPVCPAFTQVEAMAEAIVGILMEETQVIPIVLEHDFAKALGQALKRRLPEDKAILCLDGVSCQNGDFIDIGKSVGDGVAFPIIVKTLIFGAKERKQE